MKTIIVKPNTKDRQYGLLKSLSAIEPPLWCAIFANYYKADTIIDAEVEDFSEEETVEAILSTNPKTVIIMATGSHPSAHIQQKEAVISLAKKLEGKVPDIQPLFTLPLSPCRWTPPRWDLLPMKHYRAHNWHCWGEPSRYPYGTIFTSTGCPFNCDFCCIKSFYGHTFEQRLMEDIERDFDDLAKLNIKNVKIMDELFLFNKKRAELICDSLIDKGYDFNIWAYARIDIVDKNLLKKMRKAGIKWLAYGIETGNEIIRKKMSKGKFNNEDVEEVVNITKDAGINVLGNYMFGFWDDTLRTMRETLDFAKKLKCEYSNFYCTVAYPGSQLYQEMVDKGFKLPKESSSYAQVSPNFKPLPTNYLSPKEVLNFRDWAFHEYFTDSNYLQMMDKKFGHNVVTEILNMASIKLSRDKHD